MSVNAYLIQCITNLHVGSGDANYGIVDKLVQRDTVFNYPTIHSSSLKGALREHYEKIWENDIGKINDVFGKKTANDSDAESGNCNFLNADLMALPVRCSHKQFALTFCPQSIEAINTKAQMLVNKNLLKTPTAFDKLFTNDNINSIYLEDDNIQKAIHTKILLEKVEMAGFTALDKQYAIVSNDKFDNYTDNLPVIARNRLGENKNLWYEEVVPHQSLFITYIISNSENYSEFKKELLKNIFQIGANSSVGYGLCKFHKINFTS